MVNCKRRKDGICEQCRKYALLKVHYPLCDACYLYQIIAGNPDTIKTCQKWKKNHPEYFKAKEQVIRMRELMRKRNNIQPENYRV
jgi:hypothetical protein